MSSSGQLSEEPGLLQGSMEMKEMPSQGASASKTYGLIEASSESDPSPPTVSRCQSHFTAHDHVQVFGPAADHGELPARSKLQRQGNQISEIHETQLHSVTGSLTQEQDNGRMSASGIQTGSLGPTAEQPRLQVCQPTGSPRDQIGSPGGQPESRRTRR